VSLCVFVVTARAEAQLTSGCLRPIAIPDKWIENQTPPLDGSDRFDIGGVNPDVYVPELGYNAANDDGRSLNLSAGYLDNPPRLEMYLPKCPVNEPWKGGAVVLAGIAAVDRQSIRWRDTPRFCEGERVDGRPLTTPRAESGGAHGEHHCRR
jgi:hypothetical protein